MRLRFHASVCFDPGLDVIEVKTEVAPESVVGDGVAVAPCRASIDEGLRHPDQGGDVVHGEVPRGERELELSWCVRFPFWCHAADFLLLEEVKQST